MGCNVGKNVELPDEDEGEDEGELVGEKKAIFQSVQLSETRAAPAFPLSLCGGSCNLLRSLERGLGLW